MENIQNAKLGVNNEPTEEGNVEENTQVDPYTGLSYEDAISRLREIEPKLQEKDAKLSKLHKTITKEKEQKWSLYSHDQLNDIVNEKLSAHEHEIEIRSWFADQYGMESWNLVKQYVQQNENISIDQAAKIVWYDLATSWDTNQIPNQPTAFSWNNDVVPSRLKENSNLSIDQLKQLAEKEVRSRLGM